MEDQEKVNFFIKKIILNYKLSRSLKGFLRGVIVSLILTVLLFLLNIFNFHINSGYFLWIILSSPVVIGVLWGFLWPYKKEKIILKADNIIGLEERLITYYEYRNKDNPLFEILVKELGGLIDYLFKRKIFQYKWMPEVAIAGFLLIVIIIFNVLYTDSNIYIDDKYSQPGNVEEINYLNEQNNEKRVTGEEKDEIHFLNPYEIVNLSEKEEPVEVGKTDDSISEDLEGEKSEMDSFENGTGKESLQKRMMSNEDNRQSNSSGKDDNSGNADNKTLQKGDSDKKGEEELLSNPGEEESGSKTDEGKKIALNEGEKKENTDKGEGQRGKGYQQKGIEEELALYQDKGNLYLPDDKTGKKNQQAEVGESKAGQGESGEGKDQYQRQASDYLTSKLRAELNKESFLKTYLEQLLPPDEEGVTDNPEEGFLYYRKILYNTLENTQIPVQYKELVRDYFIIINQE